MGWGVARGRAPRVQAEVIASRDRLRLEDALHVVEEQRDQHGGDDEDEPGLCRRLAHLEQDGWQVEYGSYSQQAGYWLPERMKLHGQDLDVTLVIKAWQPRQLGQQAKQ